MFGLGKTEKHESVERLVELTDLEGQPVIFEAESIVSVHMHRGITHVNLRDIHTGRHMFFKVKETPLHIKSYMTPRKV